MSDATLWIDDTNGTAAVKSGSAIHTMPLWAFEGMRDIIVAEAEKKVEVTHRDFDIQQELLDRHRAENAKLRELVRDTLCATNPDPHSLFWEYNDPYSFWANFRMRARKLGIEVD